MILVRHFFFFATLVAILPGVSLLSAGEIRFKPEPVLTLWASRTFIGGPKCAASGPTGAFQAPGFETEKERLSRAGIRVLRAYYRDLSVCEACHTCPTYRREILFEIAVSDLEKLPATGYNRSAAPSTDELRDYERSKIFIPAPDIPPEE